MNQFTLMWTLSLIFADLAQILQRREGEVYVHYVDKDKRLDEWIPDEEVTPIDNTEANGEIDTHAGPSRRRKRDTHPSSNPATPPPTHKAPSPTSVEPERDDDETAEVVMTEEDFDFQHHKQITAHRNFDKVNFGHWQIKTWSAQ